MVRTLILETTFVIDLERETLARAPGPATAVLDAHPEDSFGITLTTAGELAAGLASGDRENWERLLRRFRLFVPDAATAWRYGQIHAYLKRNGIQIGANDLWIAATALTHGAPLVTRDVSHYARVPDLEVLEY